MPIHPTAIVDKRAEIDDSVEIGAYAIVESGVKIAAGCRLFPHAYISQGTTLAERVTVHPFAVVGHHPQDLAWKETPSYTVIGAGSVLREHSTVHRGTPPETTTVVGKRCFLMSTAHIGHNCAVGDDVKLANSACAGGWVTIGDGCFLSAGAMIHQFVRIGKLCMVSGASRITNDLVPFMTVLPHGPIGPNVIGLRRAGLSAEARAEIRQAHRLLFRSGLLVKDALERLAATAKTQPAHELIEFLRAPSKRGIFRLRQSGRSGAASEYGADPA